MEEFIIQQYLNNISIAQLQKITSKSRNFITKILKDNNIEVRCGRRKSCYVDENYFNNIDTEDKAYWFGFLYADGYITNKGFSLCLMRSDRTHLEKMSKYMKSTYKIGDYKNKGFDNKEVLYSKISIYSNKMKEDLVSRGMVENKSLILKGPTNIPKTMIRHFIRGFFDGNGSISGLKKSTYTVKICSTDSMLEWILENSNIKIPKFTKRRPTDIVSSAEFHSLKMMKFLDMIYKDCTVYLDRKFEKYKKVSKERGCM